MVWPVPQITEDTGAFWTGGRDGTLVFTRCQDCGYYSHPPSPRCGRCHGDRVEPSPVSGRATVYTYTINRRAWVPGLDVPYVLAVVQMDEQEDLRLVTNVVGCPPEEVQIGMPVEVAFMERGEAFIPVFRPSRS